MINPSLAPLSLLGRPVLSRAKALHSLHGGAEYGGALALAPAPGSPTLASVTALPPYFHLAFDRFLPDCSDFWRHLDGALALSLRFAEPKYPGSRLGNSNPSFFPRSAMLAGTFALLFHIFPD